MLCDEHSTGLRFSSETRQTHGHQTFLLPVPMVVMPVDHPCPCQLWNLHTDVEQNYIHYDILFQKHVYTVWIHTVNSKWCMHWDIPARIGLVVSTYTSLLIMVQYLFSTAQAVYHRPLIALKLQTSSWVFVAQAVLFQQSSGCCTALGTSFLWAGHCLSKADRRLANNGSVCAAACLSS